MGKEERRNIKIKNRWGDFTPDGRKILIYVVGGFVIPQPIT
ncbi:hypothetical protein [Dethiothermospora halolimnae]